MRNAFSEVHMRRSVPETPPPLDDVTRHTGGQCSQLVNSEPGTNIETKWTPQRCGVETRPKPVDYLGCLHGVLVRHAMLAFST
jgi:hypothetical protein